MNRNVTRQFALTVTAHEPLRLPFNECSRNVGNSLAGGDADQALDEYQRCEAIERRMPALQQRVQRADAAIASAVTPHQFRGQEVAGQSVVLDLGGTRPVSGAATALHGWLVRGTEWHDPATGV